MGDIKNIYKILFGKHECKRLLGRSRCRWKENIKIDRDKERDLKDTVMNLRIL
jgi:hypothetical protein